MATSDIAWLSYLGLARRAGLLVIGQDNVLMALKRKKRNYVVIMTTDRSESLARSLEREVFSRNRIISLGNMTREQLGEAIGLMRCQIVALPEGEGLTDTVILRLKEGGEAIE